MSQRECAGFNWPPLAVATWEPVGRGPEASAATSFSGLAFFVKCSRGTPFQSRACGVGHPIRSVADVRGADARSRERNRPEGVAQGFQVSVYKVDPRPCSRACNLLAKDDCRAALADEVMPCRP